MVIDHTPVEESFAISTGAGSISVSRETLLALRAENRKVTLLSGCTSGEITEGRWAIRKVPQETNMINVNSMFFIYVKSHSYTIIKFKISR